MASEPANSVSPQWVRETLCEDLADMDRRAGRIPDTRTIEQVVDGDIQNFQAREREKKPFDNKARKAREQAAKAEERKALEAENRAKGLTNDGLDKDRPAHSLAESLGYKLVKKPPAPKVSRRVMCKCGGWRCKTCKLYARIQELLRMKPEYKARTMEWIYKQPLTGIPYAQMIIDEAHRRQRGVGDYQGLNDYDCDQVLRRKMEDIADKSNAHPGLGNWWVT